ncbi:MAG: baseplate wedge protein 53 [Culicoidibacterales bacterium]
MIFNFFDAVDYKGVPTANIFQNYTGLIKRAAKSFTLRKYQINGSPRPELLSHELYGNVRYYWILLALNDIADPFYDWVCEQEAVHQHTIQKYQNMPNGVNTIVYHVDTKGKKHYRMQEYPINSGNWYDIGDNNHAYIQYVGALAPVTAIEDALDKNDDKRIIQIIHPSDLTRFIDILKRMMEVQKNATR